LNYNLQTLLFQTVFMLSSLPNYTYGSLFNPLSSINNLNKPWYFKAPGVTS